MLNNQSIQNIMKTKINYTPIKVKIENQHSHKTKNIHEDFFCVDKKCDSLIWYYHILLKGVQSYNFLKNNSYQEENKIKMELVYKIREKKQILKNHKIKYREVESNLCNEKDTNINTFLALLIISDINFFYSDDKFYYNCLINSNLDNYCYLHKKEDKYYLWQGDKPGIDSLEEKLITINDLNRPLKTMSHYKKNELEDWCKKLKIKYQFVGEKKFTKNKLYALIQENII